MWDNHDQYRHEWFLNPGPRRVGSASSVQTGKVAVDVFCRNFLKVPRKVWGRCPPGEEGAVCSIWIWSASLHGGGSGQGHPPHLLCHPHQAAQVIAKDMGGSQRDNDSSPILLFNDLKQKEIEIKEGSAHVLWYETQLLIGQPNGGSPKFQEGSPKLISYQTYSLVYCSLSRVLRF